MTLKKRQTFAKGFKYAPPLQSLSLEKIDCFCPCKKILDCMAEDVSLI